MPVTLTETVHPLDRDQWEAPELPELPTEPWAGVPAFWRESVSARPVDVDRTNRLADDAGDEWVIGANAGGAPYKGTSYGMPFHLVDSTGPMTPVWDLSQPVTWRWFTPQFPIVDVPLPDVVRREGDPGTAFDCHAYFFDPRRQVLWEAMQLDNPAILDPVDLFLKKPNPRVIGRVNRRRTFGRCDWAAGYHDPRTGQIGGGIVRWDCTRPWAAAGQPRGLVAANIPQFPLILRWDEIERGRILHALFLAVPKYAPEVTGPARGTDGHVDFHALRAGERLRLPTEMVHRYPHGSTERIVAECLVEFGCIVGDTAPNAGFTVAQDRRFTHGSDRRGPLGPLGLRVSDLVVVKS